MHWPAPVGAAEPPALVVLFVDIGQSDEEACVGIVAGLVGRLGAVVLTVEATHAIEAHATVSWAADHAAELGADPRRLVIVGAAGAAALAERVAELALDEGWPPLLRVALIWPHDDPGVALDDLAGVLTAGPAGADPRRAR